MKVIFVVSPPRCGGTLLYGILCSDPDVTPVLMENHFVSNAVTAYTTCRERLEFEQGHFFSDLDDLQKFFREWLHSFFEKVRLKHAPAQHVAIKSITLGPCCPALFELFPDALFVLALRDPRDIVASMINVGIKQEANGKPNSYPRDTEQLSKQLMASYQSSLACQTPGFRERLLVVKYEELVSNPESTIKSIEASTGLDLCKFDPGTEWPSSLRNFKEQAREGRAFITEAYGGPVTRASVGNFREILTPDEIHTVERICQPLIKMFNYA